MEDYSKVKASTENLFDGMLGVSFSIDLVYVVVPPLVFHRFDKFLVSSPLVQTSVESSKLLAVMVPLNPLLRSSVAWGSTMCDWPRLVLL